MKCVICDKGTLVAGRFMDLGGNMFLKPLCVEHAKKLGLKTEPAK